MKKYFAIALLFTSSLSLSQDRTADNLYLLELFQSQRYNEASEQLKKIYPEPIEDKKILSRFGYSLRMAGRYAEAESYYNRILVQDPSDISALFSMAGISQSKGNNKKARDYYKLILDVDSNNFAVYKQLSDIVESTEGLTFAAAYLQKANELNPADGDIAYSFARLLKDTKLFDRAANVLAAAILADTTNMLLIRGKAELAHATADWREVVDMCSRLIREGETEPNIVRMLGEAFYQTRRYDEAIKILVGLEQNALQSERTLYFIGMSYKALKNYPKAAEYLDKTITEAISTNVADYYALLGDVNEQAKLYRKAIAAYQRGLTFRTKPIVLYSLATIYDLRLNDKASALRFYKRYVSSKPPKDHLAYIDYSKQRIKELGG